MCWGYALALTLKKLSRSNMKHITLVAALLVTSALSMPHNALAATNNSAQVPSLIITNDPLPASLRGAIYSKPVQVRAIQPSEVMNRDYYTGGQTIVGQKIGQISSNLAMVQGKVESIANNIRGLEQNNERRAANYYADIATINTQLHSGTTPGNPRLVSRLNSSEAHLEDLNNTIAQFNAMAVDSSAVASEASFLLEETRAAYNLSGAVEEDHVHLAQVEDSITNTLTIIQRVLNNVNDDITRTSTYLSSERENLRILSLAVANGDFYGRSLASRPFSGAPAYQGNVSAQPASYSAAQQQSAEPMRVSSSDLSGGSRPLAKIRFDRADVNYEEPVYLAVNEALKRYPNARFDLIAVTPTQGNAAQVAIESTKARRNAEKVLRTLTQMGLEQDRIDIAYSEDANAVSNEVHLMVK